MPWTSTEHIKFRNLVANWHLAHKGKLFDNVMVRKQLPPISDAEYKKFLNSAWHFVNAEYPRWLVKLIQAEQQAEKAEKQSPVLPETKTPEQAVKKEDDNKYRDSDHETERQRLAEGEYEAVNEPKQAGNDRDSRIAPEAGADARPTLPVADPPARENRVPGDFWCAKCLGWRDRDSFASDKRRFQQICLFHGLASNESSKRAREGSGARTRSHD